MATSTKDQLGEVIEFLATKAKKCNSAIEALQYTQAILNAANTMMTLKNVNS